VLAAPRATGLVTGEEQGVWEEASRDLPSLSRGHLEEPLAWLPLSDTSSVWEWRRRPGRGGQHGKEQRRTTLTRSLV
jgi:hypothetical protein